MIALLRYMFLKSFRDRSLAAFTLLSAGSLVMARIGIRSAELARDIRIMHDGFGPEMIGPAAASSVAMAGIAAFWVLRVEIRDRSIGSMILAARAPLIASAVTIYSLIVGIVSYLLTIPITGTDVPREVGSFGNLFLFTTASLIVGGAWGIATATASPEPPMILVTCAGVITIFVTALNVIQSALVIGALVVTTLLIITTSILLERRCAA